MRPQAILMREWTDDQGDLRRLYRLTEPYGSHIHWIGLYGLHRRSGIWYAYVATEGDDRLGRWLDTYDVGDKARPPAKVLAKLGYEEIVP